MNNFDLSEFNHEKHLRISIIPDCQLACFYCTNEGQENLSSQLTTEEWIDLIRFASEKEGYRHIRITGGEPTLRRDLSDIIIQISKSVKSIGLNTNCVDITQLNDRLSPELVQYVSTSLDTNDDKKFKRITKSNLPLNLVTENIKSLAGVGYRLKVNTVLMKGVNESDIGSIIDFCKENSLIYSLCDYFGRRKELYLDPVSFLKERFNASIVDESYSLTKLEIEGIPLIASRMKCDYTKKIRDYCIKCGLKDEMKITSDGNLKPCFILNKYNVDVSSSIDDHKKLKVAFKKARSNRIEG